jgi:hypothetical protein
LEVGTVTAGWLSRRALLHFKEVPMRSQKLVQLLLAVAVLAIAASGLLTPAPAGANSGCHTFCCPDLPTRCGTCCPRPGGGIICTDLNCP